MLSLEFMLSALRFHDTKGCCAEHEDLTQQFSASELQAIRATTAATLRKAEEQLVAAGKWSYHLFHSIPTVAGTCNASQCNATECVAEVLEGARLGASHIPGVMTASDHHSDKQQEWDIKRDLAAFLIGRGNYSWIGEDWMATRPPIFYPEWGLDYGTPLVFCQHVYPQVLNGRRELGLRHRRDEICLESESSGGKLGLK